MQDEANAAKDLADEEEVDLSRFEAKTTAAPPKKPGRKSNRLPRANYPFKRLPDFWVTQLVKAQCLSTMKLAHLLLKLDWETREKPIELGNDRLAEAGISADAKLRALAELEVLGVVRIERTNQRPFKSPIVTLIKKP
jgi:hypothetical protein